MIDFTSEDLKQIEEKGISTEKVARQIETFKEGIPFVNLKKAATANVGITEVDESLHDELVSYFENNIEGLKLLKFVPASGAASRMFKAMFNFIEAYDPKNETLSDYITRTNDQAVKQFFEGIEKFPFYTIVCMFVTFLICLHLSLVKSY